MFNNANTDNTYNGNDHITQYINYFKTDAIYSNILPTLGSVPDNAVILNTSIDGTLADLPTTSNTYQQLDIDKLENDDLSAFILSMQTGEQNSSPYSPNHSIDNQQGTSYNNNQFKSPTTTIFSNNSEKSSIVKKLTRDSIEIHTKGEQFPAAYNRAIVPGSSMDKKVVRLANNCYRYVKAGLNSSIYGQTLNFINEFKMLMNLPDSFTITQSQLHNAANSHRIYKEKLMRIKIKANKTGGKQNELTLTKFNELIQGEIDPHAYIRTNLDAIKHCIRELNIESNKPLDFLQESYPFIFANLLSCFSIITDKSKEEAFTDALRKVLWFLVNNEQFRNNVFTPQTCIETIHNQLKAINEGPFFTLYEEGCNLSYFKRQGVEFLVDHNSNFYLLIDGVIILKTQKLSNLFATYKSFSDLFKYNAKTKCAMKLIEKLAVLNREICDAKVNDMYEQIVSCN
uniref:NR LBD domain-containing protein n=1 Tax=Rhabditophanes sp. KR3021 TaxID=114890 RepID=A0AC35TZS8_9BILA